MIAILILVMYVPVYADTNIPPLPTDGWEYWVIVNIGTSSNRVLGYLTSHNPIKVWKPKNHQLQFNTFKWYSYSENGWKVINEGLEYSTMYFTEMYAANHNIAYAEGSDDFFFESPKVPPLSQAMKTVDFGTILRNFSVGLIPILGLIVSFIAFRKAWAFLRNQLQS